jgi:hypothetical protein
LTVTPGNSDLCFVWPGPVEDAIVHHERHGVEVENGPFEADHLWGGWDATSVFATPMDRTLRST